MTHRLLLALILILLIPSFALAQEAEPTAEASTAAAALERFYSEELLYGMPIPLGWTNVSDSDAWEHFTNSSGDQQIYALRVGTSETAAAIQSALEQINPTYAVEPLETSSVNLTNGTWTQQLFKPSEDVSITALGQFYQEATFVLLYVEESTTAEIIPLIVQSQDVQAGITQAIQRAVDPAFEDSPTETSVIDENPGGEPLIQNTYTLPNGDLLIAQGQVRGSFTYVILQRSTPNALPPVDNAFFTAALGFFVTPENSSYLTLGIAAVAVILLLFIASMFVRYTNAQKDIALAEQLRAEA